MNDGDEEKSDTDGDFGIPECWKNWWGSENCGFIMLMVVKLSFVDVQII